jgi:DNA gyrase/topoisomerase IV subunit A
MNKHQLQQMKKDLEDDKLRKKYKDPWEKIRELERELAEARAQRDCLAETMNEIRKRAQDITIMLHPDNDAKGCVDDCWEWSEQALAAVKGGDA